MSSINKLLFGATIVLLLLSFIVCSSAYLPTKGKLSVEEYKSMIDDIPSKANNKIIISEQTNEPVDDYVNDSYEEESLEAQQLSEEEAEQQVVEQQEEEEQEEEQDSSSSYDPTPTSIQNWVFVYFNSIPNWTFIKTVAFTSEGIYTQLMSISTEPQPSSTTPLFNECSRFSGQTQLDCLMYALRELEIQLSGQDNNYNGDYDQTHLFGLSWRTLFLFLANLIIWTTALRCICRKNRRSKNKKNKIAKDAECCAVEEENTAAKEQQDEKTKAPQPPVHSMPSEYSPVYAPAPMFQTVTEPAIYPSQPYYFVPVNSGAQ